MRRLRAGLGLILGVVLVLPGPALAAMSCSTRNQECVSFCEKAYKGRPGCTTECADAMPKCLQSGCWVTRMANRCGYTKG